MPQPDFLSLKSTDQLPKLGLPFSITTATAGSILLIAYYVTWSPGFDLGQVFS